MFTTNHTCKMVLLFFPCRDMYKENLSKIDSSCIGTLMEVQSLQLLSFLYCISHILIVVQDSLGDPNLIRLDNLFDLISHIVNPV